MLRFTISMLSAIIVGDLLFSRKLLMSGVLISIVGGISTLKHSTRVLIVALFCAFKLLETLTGREGAGGSPDQGSGTSV